MRDVTSQNFGLLIAFVLPGLATLWAMGEVVPSVQAWMIATLAVPTGSSSMNSLLAILLASVTAGMTTSAIRWAIIDRVHRWTGLRRPTWDDSQLQDKLAGFEALVDNHYRHYQFYANMLVATVLLMLGRTLAGECWINWDRFNSAMALLCIVYWVGSRDTLRNYYARAVILLGTSERMVRDGERTLSQHDGDGERETSTPHKPGSNSPAAEEEGEAAK